MFSDRNIYYLTSIVVGGCLMAMEILIAKLIGPYFGASLYVWAATIGTTMLGLALGYYYGGVLSEKPNLANTIFKSTLILSIYILITPLLSGLIMDSLISLEVKTGIIISTLIFNFPLFVLFGLFSPMIIQILTTSIEESGNYSGVIYGLSTISGVVFMIILGVYILPSIGMYPPVYFCGILILMVSMLHYFKLKRNEK